MSGATVIAENDGSARLGPMRPSGGVDWNRWTHPEKVRLENVTGNSVTYRNRKQWGKGKFVVVSGTEGTLRHTLNMAIHRLRQLEEGTAPSAAPRQPARQLPPVPPPSAMPMFIPPLAAACSIYGGWGYPFYVPVPMSFPQPRPPREPYTQAAAEDTEDEEEEEEELEEEEEFEEDFEHMQIDNDEPEIVAFKPAPKIKPAPKLMPQSKRLPKAASVPRKEVPTAPWRQRFSSLLEPPRRKRTSSSRNVDPADEPTASRPRGRTPIRRSDVNIKMFTAGYSKLTGMPKPWRCTKEELRIKAQAVLRRTVNQPDFELAYVYDCTSQSDADHDKSQRNHWGENVDIMKRVLESSITLKIIEDMKIDLDPRNLKPNSQINILFLCTSGRHRSLATAKFARYFCRAEGFHVKEPEHLSKRFWRVDFCCWDAAFKTSCFKCGPGAEHLRAKLREQFLEMYSNA